MGEFSNPEMCKLTEQVIFMDPYYDAPINRWTSPMLDDDVRELRADDEARLATAELRRKFLGQPEALIHGDLHTGSLMVTQETTYAIDSEFAFYGPMGFDIGKILGNFLLGYFAIDGHATNEDHRTEQRQWLLNSAEKVRSKFCGRARASIVLNALHSVHFVEKASSVHLSIVSLCCCELILLHQGLNGDSNPESVSTVAYTLCDIGLALIQGKIP